MVPGKAPARSPLGFSAQARKALSRRAAMAGVTGDILSKWGAGGVRQLGSTCDTCGPISAALGFRQALKKVCFEATQLTVARDRNGWNAAGLLLSWVGVRADCIAIRTDNDLDTLDELLAAISEIRPMLGHAPLTARS